MKYTFLEKVMSDYGRDLATDLQKSVPVKTGALRHSITFRGLKRKVDGFEVDIEALYYFDFLDKGTKFIIPRNYLSKSKDRLSLKYTNLITDAISQDIKVSLIKELKVR